MNEEFLSTSDAAKLLNRGVDRVRTYEREGKLPAQRMGNGHRIFRRSDVLRLAKQLEDAHARH